MILPFGQDSYEKKAGIFLRCLLDDRILEKRDLLNNKYERLIVHVYWEFVGIFSDLSVLSDDYLITASIFIKRCILNMPILMLDH